MFPLVPKKKSEDRSTPAEPTAPSNTPASFALSKREAFVIQRAADGLTDRAIANELGIAVATVSTYWGRIRSKMGGGGRTELVAKYVKASFKQAHGAAATPRPEWVELIYPYAQTQEDIMRLLRIAEAHASPGAAKSYEQLAKERDLFFEHSNNICAVMHEGSFERVNRAWTTNMSYRPEDLLGTSWMLYVHPDEIDQVTHTCEKIMLGEERTCTCRFRDALGNYHLLDWVCTIDPDTNRCLTIATPSKNVT